MQGNVLGLQMGTRVGHLTLSHLRQLFGDTSIGNEHVVNLDNIVFGTGHDDSLIVAPCVPESSPVEVYGLYGDDGMSAT